MQEIMITEIKYIGGGGCNYNGNHSGSYSSLSNGDKCTFAGTGGSGRTIVNTGNNKISLLCGASTSGIEIPRNNEGSCGPWETVTVKCLSSFCSGTVT
jgi:hypothetical protein